MLDKDGQGGGRGLDLCNFLVVNGAEVLVTCCDGSCVVSGCSWSGVSSSWVPGPALASDPYSVFASGLESSLSDSVSPSWWWVEPSIIGEGMEGCSGFSSSGNMLRMLVDGVEVVEQSRVLDSSIITSWLMRIQIGECDRSNGMPYSIWLN